MGQLVTSSKAALVRAWSKGATKDGQNTKDNNSSIIITMFRKLLSSQGPNFNFAVVSRRRTSNKLASEASEASEAGVVMVPLATLHVVHAVHAVCFGTNDYLMASEKDLRPILCAVRRNSELRRTTYYPLPPTHAVASKSNTAIPRTAWQQPLLFIIRLVVIARQCGKYNSIHWTGYGCSVSDTGNRYSTSIPRVPPR